MSRIYKMLLLGCLFVTAAMLASDPQKPCASYNSDACILIFLSNGSGGGAASWPVYATPSNTGKTLYYTTNNGGNTGYIVIVSPTGIDWTIQPQLQGPNDVCSWTPNGAYVVANIAYNGSYIYNENFSPYSCSGI